MTSLEGNTITAANNIYPASGASNLNSIQSLMFSGFKEPSEFACYSLSAHQRGVHQRKTHEAQCFMFTD